MKKLHLYVAASFLMLATAAPVYAEDAHPTIHQAITTLEQTKKDLEDGEHGFGGHRAKAVEHIDAALGELHQALEYANAHPDEIKPAGTDKH